MLRKRLITVLTFNDGVLFRTKLFRPDYRYTLNFVDAWSIDEIVILNITRDQSDSRSFHAVVNDFARRCFVPLAVGGGIRSLEDVKRFLDSGADKIIVNSGAIERRELITEIAESYGSQCVVLSIDAKRGHGGRYEVRGRFGSHPTGYDPIEWAQSGERLGAGEVLLTAIDRDGWLQGYDIELCRRVAESASVPVLALGGCGSWAHMAELFEHTAVSAACTQNIYHFTERSIASAKRFLADRGVPVRR